MSYDIYIICAVMLIMAVLTPLLNPFYRILKVPKLKESEKGVRQNSPPISIIIIPGRRSLQLKKLLPRLLTQQYDAAFRIIVVTEKGNSDCENVLACFADEPRLYTTFVPTSSHYMSRTKLTVTIGVKATQTEWIMLLDAGCAPTNNHWLSTVTQDITPDTTMVVVPTMPPLIDTPAFYRFSRIHSSCYFLRQTLRGKPYMTNSQCLLFRRNDFFSQEGFLGFLQEQSGEYDILVNKFGGDRCVVTVDPDAFLEEAAPSKKQRIERRLMRRHLTPLLRRGTTPRFLRRVDTVAVHINYLFISLALATAVICSIHSLQAGMETLVDFSPLIIGITAIVALLITITLRAALIKKAFHVFHIHKGCVLTLLFEIFLFWQDLVMRLRYIRADKNNFTSHKFEATHHVNAYVF